MGEGARRGHAIPFIGRCWVGGDRPACSVGCPPWPINMHHQQQRFVSLALAWDPTFFGGWLLHKKIHAAMLLVCVCVCVCVYCVLRDSTYALSLSQCLSSFSVRQSHLSLAVRSRVRMTRSTQMPHNNASAGRGERGKCSRGLGPARDCGRRRIILGSSALLGSANRPRTPADWLCWCRYKHVCV
jgi:hypothetical protein